MSMSAQNPSSRSDPRDAVPASVRGAVDLGAAPAGGSGGVAPGASGAGAPSAGAPGRFRRDAENVQQFQEIAELSAQVPVVLVLWAGYSQESVQFVDQVAGEIDAFDGRILLTAVDIEKLPEIAQALQVQSVPSVVAMIGGRPVPIAQSTVPVEQLAPVFKELLTLAEQNGVQGTVEPAAPAESEPEPLPPLHQEAVDKLEAGDLDGAEEAYQRAIRENPGDNDAKLALAQVHLLQRVTVMDAAAVREAAAERPDDLQAQLDAADLDLSGGHVEDAFRRLLNLVRRSAGDDRETVRKRLIDLFAVVGAEDQRVVAARSQLMRALF
ncbi:tetratricopeptide repeat protein [Kocuria coralli]|uniref:Tetratricopeptide repeat protein n=1 Tax=Kocuria coralli TaxID=1461025 RepID=A0A5J5L1F0_9MICC|nr:tetratricopeptide repeat protein [Kocuria coralli]KAA9395663.1 tetratricopeptide repeat protein [Kocuria coralli]